MNFKPIVRELQAAKEIICGVDLSDTRGKSLAESIYILRDIEKCIKTKETNAKKALREESDSIEGVYEFVQETTRRDSKDGINKFLIILSERYGLPLKDLEALREECKTETTSEKLKFAKGFSI